MSPDAALPAQRSGVSVLPYMPAQVPGLGERHVRERDQARAAGYAEGWSTGQRAAYAELEQRRAALDAHAEQEATRLRQRHDSALAALQAAADALHARQTPVLDDVAATLLQAAVQIAEDLLARELATVGDGADCALRRALRAVGDVRPVRLHLNPGDAEMLADVPVPEGVTLVPDTTLDRGDAVAVHDGGSVDARIGTALQRAREVLAR